MQSEAEWNEQKEKYYKMLVEHLGAATNPAVTHPIATSNLQYADSIIIKKIGSIPKENGPNTK